MDPQQLAETDRADHVPELPAGPSVAAAYGGALVHNALDRPSSDSDDSTTASLHKSKGTTHVDIGHFNPEGVDELRRTMSQVSRPDSHARRSYASEDTLKPGDGPFDFEKTLRRAIRKCVHLDEIEF